ncbi:hypothetical protein ACFXNW_00620 [Nocardia sp. NPDC059180]|uniref:hypothetical protein n=1 Tax=Nocardia sp. NPDC059180 TaxID=3346761 RepID=UPI0036797F06
MLSLRILLSQCGQHLVGEFLQALIVVFGSQANHEVAGTGRDVPANQSTAWSAAPANMG